MNILIAPDSFKECLSAETVAHILSTAFKQLCPTAKITTLPLSDGGEGFARIAAQNGKKHFFRAHDALMRPIKSAFYLTPDKTAFLETATPGTGWSCTMTAPPRT